MAFFGCYFPEIRTLRMYSVVVTVLFGNQNAAFYGCYFPKIRMLHSVVFTLQISERCVLWHCEIKKISLSGETRLLRTAPGRKKKEKKCANPRTANAWPYLSLRGVLKHSVLFFTTKGVKFKCCTWESDLAPACALLEKSTVLANIFSSAVEELKNFPKEGIQFIEWDVLTYIYSILNYCVPPF